MQEISNQDNKLFLRLRDAIIRKGCKQQELAQATGLSKVAISKYINGIVTPKYNNLTKMANFLDVSVEWLISGMEETTDCCSLEEGNWKSRALAAEERLERIEKILNELFAFARIGKN